MVIKRLIFYRSNTTAIKYCNIYHDNTIDNTDVGQDLSKFVNRQRMSQLSENTAYQIWIDISSGMEYLHANNIFHLDIKAENVLLSERGRAKICDLGYSVQHAVEPIPFNGGTPTYTPPEFVPSGNRGSPADVWGGGLIMGFVLGSVGNNTIWLYMAKFGEYNIVTILETAILYDAYIEILI